MPSQAAQAVIDLIVKRDHVTFVEIERTLQSLIPTKGRIALEIGSHPNLILWSGMSQDWADVMKEVQATGLVTIEPASLLVYMIDGAVPDMPVAKRLPKGGYATEHWAPVCFRPKAKTPSPKRRGRRKHAPQAGG